MNPDVEKAATDPAASGGSLAFTLSSLPYAQGALEPHVSARTMGFNHSKHQQACVDSRGGRRRRQRATSKLSGIGRAAPGRRGPRFMRHILLFAVAIFLASCSSGGDKPKPTSQLQEPNAALPAESHEPVEAETRVEMVNVNIHLDPELILHIRRLEGKLLPTREGHPPAFDDKLSYIIAVDSGEVGVSMAGMTHVMNTYVFGDPDAPLKNLRLSSEGSQIRQEGTLKKGIGIPFEIVATIGATPDGKIRAHPTQMRAEHIPVKGLLKLFGLDMAKLINTRKTKGISVDDNDIILDPARMLPPPRMRGRITAVRVQGDELIQIFGNETRNPAVERPRSNYMAYRGGILRFGKLTMNDVDMQLIDADPSDPFEFYPDHYKEQLVAGYSKTTPSGGLRVYMPDYGKISRPLSPPK